MYQPTLIRFACTLFFVVVATTPAYPITLGEAVDLAVQNDPVFLAAQASLNVSRERSAQALSALLPRIDASANTMHNRRDYTYEAPANTNLLEKYNSSAVQLNLTQPLWQRAKYISLNQADIVVRQADYQLAAAGQDLLVRLSQAWFDVMGARDAAVASNANVLAMQQLWEQFRRANELGVAPVTDLEEARAKYDQALAEQAMAESEQGIKLAALEQIVGPLVRPTLPVLPDPFTPPGLHNGHGKNASPENERSEVSSLRPNEIRHARFPHPNPPPEGEGAQIPSPQSSPAHGRGGERENQLSTLESLREFHVNDTLERWLDQAETSSPQILAAQRALEAADEEVRKQRAGHEPTLDLVASYGKSSQGAGISGGQNGFESKLNTVGVQFNAPLYAGGGQSAKVREAHAMREKAKYELESAIRTVRQSVKQAWFTWQAGHARQQSALQELKRATFAIKAAEQERDRGVKVELDVLQAKQQREAARRDLHKARYDMIAGYIKLKAATGQLLGADLAELDKGFDGARASRPQ